MEQARTTLETLMQLAGFPSCTIDVGEVAGQTVFQIQTKEPKTFIGMRGETLRALDYLVKKMSEKPNTPNPHFIVDVDGYRTKKIEDLQQKALMMAGRAQSFKYDVELTPMSAYERLIVHSSLSEVPNVKTESRGEGRDRRVVIKYVDSVSNEVV
jgi:spoIIIJ-associated protein